MTRQLLLRLQKILCNTRISTYSESEADLAARLSNQFNEAYDAFLGTRARTTGGQAAFLNSKRVKDCGCGRTTERTGLLLGRKRARARGKKRKEGRNNEAKGPTRGPRVGFQRRLGDEIGVTQPRHTEMAKGGSMRRWWREGGREWPEATTVKV